MSTAEKQEQDWEIAAVSLMPYCTTNLLCDPGQGI